ncbi:unnamed protein product [Amoebophrya sp. A25]|nr:unnamed protein product [Amoebophrya sp. A25]|eukprot:GSA25T00008339001.1
MSSASNANLVLLSASTSSGNIPVTKDDPPLSPFNAKLRRKLQDTATEIEQTTNDIREATFGSSSDQHAEGVGGGGATTTPGMPGDNVGDNEITKDHKHPPATSKPPPPPPTAGYATTLQRLHRTMDAEIKRRVQASKALSHLVEDMAHAMFLRGSRKAADHIRGLAVQIQALRTRCGTLERKKREIGTDSTELQQIRSRLLEVQVALSNLESALVTSFAPQCERMDTAVEKYIDSAEKKDLDNIQAFADSAPSVGDLQLILEEETSRAEAVGEQDPSTTSEQKPTPAEEFHAYCQEALLYLRKTSDEARHRRQTKDSEIMALVDKYAENVRAGIRNDPGSSS